MPLASTAWWTRRPYIPEPPNAGSSAGWILITRQRSRATAAGGNRLRDPASTTSPAPPVAGTTPPRSSGGARTPPGPPPPRARIGAARDHAGNAGDGRVAQRVEQRLKVRAAARDEHGHGNRRHRLQGASERGFVPGTTLSVYAPVANRSLLVTTMK